MCVGVCVHVCAFKEIVFRRQKVSSGLVPDWERGYVSSWSEDLEQLKSHMNIEATKLSLPQTKSLYLSSICTMHVYTKLQLVCKCALYGIGDFTTLTFEPSPFSHTADGHRFKRDVFLQP